MADCEKLEKCPFFLDKMANMPAVADLMKQEFCKGSKTDCARYMVSSAGVAVPSDLFPNDREKAIQLCKKH